MRRTILSMLGVGLLTGCVSADTLLVNSDGKYVHCQNSGWGYIGAPVAASRQKRCVKDAESAGYRLVTDPGPGNGATAAAPRRQSAGAAE